MRAEPEPRQKADHEREHAVGDARAGDGATDGPASHRLLHATAVESKGNISDRWTDVQDTWHGHVAGVRESIEEKRAEHDADKAERRADNAESDAPFAIDFAYSAIQEAGYAVLDANLARMEADELATSA